MKAFIRMQFMLVSGILAVNMSYGQPVGDSVYYHRLFYLCKAWGHAKYHHTGIAAGNINWDNELFTAIHAAKYSATDAGFNDTLQLILNNAGPMEMSSDTLPDVPDSLNNMTDYSWIQDPIFSDTVRALLDTIRSWFRPQSNVYLSYAFPNGNLTFPDEQYYTESAYPDENKRLLALFRYWNIIDYFAPYKYLMDQDWDTTLVEFIPQIVAASDSLSYALTFKKLVKRIDDTHSYLFSEVYKDWRGRYFPPFYIRYLENETVISKVLPGNEEISPGDIVLAIDGVDIDQLRDSLRQYAHGSNDVVIERELNAIIEWGDSATSQVVLYDGVQIDTVDFERNAENYDSIWTSNSPVWQDTIINGTCDIGIVDMGRLEAGQVNDMFEDLWETDGIIFDLRNYPLGTLWVIVDYLYPGPINIANFTYPEITYPGTFKWNNAYIGSGMSQPYNGIIRLLFDEETQSQAEYTCMGLEQHPGAIKIGSTTAAADGNVSEIRMPGKISTWFSGLGIYYPDYTPTQRVGIIPDYEVIPTIAGIRAGIDEVLDFALDCFVEVEESNVLVDMQLYPNPFHDRLSYELAGHEDYQPVQIEIIDIYGRMIERVNKYPAKGEIDLSGITSGAYIVKVSAGNDVIVRKVLKQ